MDHMNIWGLASLILIVYFAQGFQHSQAQKAAAVRELLSHLVPEKLLASAGILFKSFRQSWQLQLLRVPPSPGTASDVLQPLLFIAARSAQPSTVEVEAPGPPPITYSLDATPGAPNARQLTAAIEVGLSSADLCER